MSMYIMMHGCETQEPVTILENKTQARWAAATARIGWDSGWQIWEVPVYPEIGPAKNVTDELLKLDV